MIVIEASAMVHALVGEGVDPELLALLADEVDEAVEDFAAFWVERHPMTNALGRILDLRHNFTVYDAAYVVLAQALGAPLVTSDEKLAEARRLGVEVRVFAQR